MDSASNHTSPMRVAAVVAFYMGAALVVCPFWLSSRTVTLIRR
jgi:hypothetical protein